MQSNLYRKHVRELKQLKELLNNKIYFQSVTNHDLQLRSPRKSYSKWHDTQQSICLFKRATLHIPSTTLCLHKHVVQQ